jgi:hypothetical protein
MRAGPIVIFHVTEQQVAEMALAEYNNLVKAFPSDRTDEGLFLRSGSPQNVYLLPQHPNFHLKRFPTETDLRPSKQ